MFKPLHGLLGRMGRDGWLPLAIIALAGVCLLLGGLEGAQQTCTAEEARLSRILSAMDGAGRVEVAVFYPTAMNDEPVAPCGAVIVAEGAGDAGVQLRLSRAVSTLLGLDSAQIDIFRLKEE